MTSPDRRTPDQIRAEIAAERGQLRHELTALKTEVTRTARLAGSGVTALGTLLVLVKLLIRRRR